MKLALLFSILMSLSAFGAGRCPTDTDWDILVPAKNKRDFKTIKRLVSDGMDPELCRSYENLFSWATQIYGEMWDEGRLDEVREFIDFLLARGVDINKGDYGWDPNTRLGSTRPIDNLTSVCATDLVYRLVNMGAEFKRPYDHERFYVRTVLQHTIYCAELADFFLNKHNMPVLDQDICAAYENAQNKWDPKYDQELRNAGYSGMNLPVFVKRIKDVYGWDVPLGLNTDFNNPVNVFCSKLLDTGVQPLPN